jgi:hypothetical protein
MPLASWSREEMAIMVYFSSRHIRPTTLRHLLLRRGYNRSVRAIERKVLTIVHNYPSLKPEGDWILGNVDHWLDDLLEDHEMVNTLIRFSAEDAKDVVLVRRPPNPRMDSRLPLYF